MKKLTALFIISMIISIPLFLTGCASEPEPAPESKPPVETPPEEKPVVTETEETAEPVVVEEPVEETVPEEPEPETTEVSEEPEQLEETEDEFVVTERVFTKAFEDIEELIRRLNIIIDKEDYEEWLQNLTDEYINYYGDSNTLKEISERPILKKYNIRLISLNDYFKYVVVPSRANARLDDLVFEDNNHVKAIMIIDDQRAILYQLENVDGNWKIGI